LTYVCIVDTKGKTQIDTAEMPLAVALFSVEIQRTRAPAENNYALIQAQFIRAPLQPMPLGL
jgi:hypothetical protein